MNKFIYEGFACIEANDERIVFSNGRGEVRLELMELDCVPMKKYKFSFEENENGEWKITAFEKNKFNEFSIFMVNYLQSKDCRLCVHFRKLYFLIHQMLQYPTLA